MRSHAGNEFLRGPEAIVAEICNLATSNIEKIRIILKISFAVLPQTLVSSFRSIITEELSQNLLSRNPGHTNFLNPASSFGVYGLGLEEVCDALLEIEDSNSNGYTPAERVTVTETHPLRGGVRKKFFFLREQATLPLPPIG